MRPATIVWFERLISATLVLGVIQIGWFSNNPRPLGIGDGVVVPYLVNAVLVVAVMLRISRWRSKLAMWFAILWSVIALPVIVADALPFALPAPGVDGKLLGWAWLAMGHGALQLFACCLLLTRSARRWINREPTLDGLQETFS